MIRVGFGIEANDGDTTAGVGVSWLPPYHDMGLIGGILESLYVGGCAVLMSPNSFIRRPERWLQLISEHRASVSGAPNFAYDLCVRNIPAEMRSQFDLSSWRVAFCGAEPVRADTLRRFAEAFAPCGFREEALYPCYGMAETTLLASGGDWRSRPRIITVDRSRLLAENIAEPCRNGSDGQDMVSCGRTILDQTLRIVEPGSGTCCPDGHVGEIWVKGDNVSPGYWDEAVDAGSAFGNVLNGTGDRPYLRTGDLGFMLDDHLYVTGRLKDLLIFRGRNHYPHDIELTAQQAHPCLVPNSGAAFSIEYNGEEELVVVQEVDRAYRGIDLDAVLLAVRREVVAEHAVDPLALVLIRQASLPRTTSGKVQRSRCRELYCAGELKVLSRWDRPGMSSSDAGEEDARPKSEIWNVPPLVNVGDGEQRERDLRQLAEQIETQLLRWLHERGGVPDEELDRDRPFAEYGIDSLAAVELSTELETWTEVPLSSVTAWKYPTPATLSVYLANEIAPPAAHVTQDEEPPLEPDASDFERLLAEIEGLSEEDAATAMRQENSADPRES
jgi:acyl carrier protein